MAKPVAAIDEGAVEIIDPGGAKWVHYVRLVWENTLPLIVVLLFWEALARSGTVNINLFPPVTHVLVRIVELAEQGIMFKDASYSLMRVLLGGTLAMIFGTVVGLFMGTSRRVEKWLVPPMNFFLCIPGIAILPIIILYLGLTDTTLIATLGFEAGLTVMLSTWTG